MEAIDNAMRQFGMPVGPIELLDDVGIDVAAKGAQTLAAAWPDRMPIDPAFGKLDEVKRIGRKSKKGFYRYEGDKRVGPDMSAYADLGLGAPGKTMSSDDMVARCIWPMVNEAAFCLSEGIVENAAKLDLAMIFGIGFPPFRGGPLAYADAVGAKTIADGLTALARNVGPRFTPAPLLTELATTGKKFHQE